MSSIAKERLIQSVTCTAVFAIVCGLVVSCTGGSPLRTIKGTNTRSMGWILSHLSLTTAALPPSGSRAPVIAALFQTSQPQGSTIQQSFQGLSCNAFLWPNGPATVNMTGATTGFIPLNVLADGWILYPNPNATGGFDAYPPCNGVFAQVGGGTSVPGPDTPIGPAGEPIGAGTFTNPGTPIYADGTLSTLIVTGYSTAGKQIRCSDLTDTAAVHDSDLVQPYFVIGTNAVVLAVGSTQLPLTCTLNIAAGDQAGSLSVQWAKI